jgi:hypothetical protein
MWPRSVLNAIVPDRISRTDAVELLDGVRLAGWVVISPLISNWSAGCGHHRGRSSSCEHRERRRQNVQQVFNVGRQCEEMV